MTANSYNINPALPQIMWVDLNSAFATIEQQAFSHLRGRPIGITNRISPECCIITASYEAKARGIKAGTRRREALRLCPDLILLESNPAKYNYVYKRLYSIMQDYSTDCGMKSIDEGYINLQHSTYNTTAKLQDLGYEIKQRIHHEIGDYITVNIGLGTNRFLAKLAAGLHKPDGMDIISSTNLVDILNTIQLEDLTGISKHYSYRLRQAGIYTPLDFLAADERFLRKSVFHGINGTYWYQRLRGYEVDAYKPELSVIGRQWMVDQNGDDDEYLASCLHFLVECVGLKLRFRQVKARGVCVWLRFQMGEHYHKKFLSANSFDSDLAIWNIARQLFSQRPGGRIICLGVYLYNFSKQNSNQPSLINDINRSANLTNAIDKINQRYGISTVHSAHSSMGVNRIEQKVPFGSTDYLDLLIE